MNDTTRLLTRLARQFRKRVTATSRTAADSATAEELASVAENLERRFAFREALRTLRVSQKFAAQHSALKSQTEVRIKRLQRILRNENDKGPGYLIVGAQKAGTTALNNFLSHHPEVCTSFVKKELHYFDSCGMSAGHQDYHKCFRPDERTRVIGEASPTYMYFPQVMAAIKHYLPSMRLIVLLRDPIERAISQYKMLKDGGGTTASFNATDLISYHHSCTSDSRRDLLGRGLYVPQLRRILDHFPPDQLLILRSEQLKHEHDSTLDQVAKFLNISPFPHIERREIHSRKYAVEVSEKDYSQLVDFFRSDVDALKKDFGVDTSGWLKRN